MNKISNAASSGVLSNRTRHTRWFVISLIPLVMVIAPSPRPEWVGDLLEALGVSCLAVCLAGRAWTSLYVAGRKDRELVVLGPYSVVRNPLYVFSFVGVVGIGLVSQMISLLAIAVTVFLVYYQVVVRREESHLARQHGESFTRYAATTPRWVPNLSRWHDAPRLEIEPRRILSHFVDSGLFFLSFIFFEFLEALRSSGLAVILLTLP